MLWPHRLTVRTSAFQADGRGSIPRGAIIQMKPYQTKILNFLAKIPKGKVATYGTVAKATRTLSPRLVGRVLHNNPDPKQFPCHRVVFKDGSLAKSFAFGGRKRQMMLLTNEGVSFIAGKVDLKKHSYL